MHKHLTISIDHNGGNIVITPSDKFNGQELRAMRNVLGMNTEKIIAQSKIVAEKKAKNENKQNGVISRCKKAIGRAATLIKNKINFSVRYSQHLIKLWTRPHTASAALTLIKDSDIDEYEITPNGKLIIKWRLNA